MQILTHVKRLVLFEFISFFPIMVFMIFSIQFVHIQKESRSILNLNRYHNIIMQWLNTQCFLLGKTYELMVSKCSLNYIKIINLEITFIFFYELGLARRGINYFLFILYHPSLDKSSEYSKNSINWECRLAT